MGEQAAFNSDTGRLYIFGPQALSFHQHYFDKIRTHIRHDSDSRWVHDAIKDGLNGWSDLEAAIPDLKLISGKRQLELLLEWLLDGETDIAASLCHRLPNTILGPLVVISQLWEYDRFQNLRQNKRGNEKSLGFCIGQLSAVVVACSRTRAQFCRNGTAAIRLAIAIGGLVDAQDARLGESVSIAVSWDAESSENVVSELLRAHADAYLAVSYDTHRATITTAMKSLHDLMSDLSASGINSSVIGLYGRYHTPIHQKNLDILLQLCNQNSALQFYSCADATLALHMPEAYHDSISPTLHERVLRAILVEPLSWIERFSSALRVMISPDSPEMPHIVSFGPERCVPSSILHQYQVNATQYSDFDRDDSEIYENDIAVIGMACNVAGAEDLEGFWNILLNGASQHTEVGTDRFVFETVFRPEAEPSRKWYGNFINNSKAFDHGFFNISPREARSMDPQQRLLLQNAYQAVSQSGYFQIGSAEREKRVGCYFGVCATDYENNVSHYQPTSFSATGNLRSFISGKISHYFGWNGPALTIDTACSSSAVAIHQACQALLNNECVLALAGGTNFISSPLWYQNLSAASFLSPTGQCKPFDSLADGYCRGEAVATVFLKKASKAIADGDAILGIIAATAVNQNHNISPIFVPNIPSLSDLFEQLSVRSRLNPTDISYVEAHGTGTAVGDPVEFESIQGFLGSQKNGHHQSESHKPVQLGSVKGLIGHTEASSGVVSLIKILLMMHNGTIVPHASFNKLNPSINYTPGILAISKQSIPWRTRRKVSLINNYGASGSNASMLVKSVPTVWRSGLIPEQRSDGPPYAKSFWISGYDDRSVRAYAKKLQDFISNRRKSLGSTLDLGDIAFNLTQQSNWSLPTATVFSCDEIKDFEQKLAEVEVGAYPVVRVPEARPIILCFGGQVSTYIGLDHDVYRSCKILRAYLDECDRICEELGAFSIFPGIFGRESITHPTQLQAMLFSMQYACARSFIDCGIRPVALIGHSFGEITALCVGGSLSLNDGLYLVLKRSQIIEERWGPEHGAMIAVEGAKQDVLDMLHTERVNEASIACFNGHRSFTLAGTVAAINALERGISDHRYPGITRYKRLDVTHAFHSPLVERLKQQLENLCRDIRFSKPSIPIERATKAFSPEMPSVDFAWEHMRQPVYFSDAIQRLELRHPSVVWIEAGSKSSITNMVSRNTMHDGNHIFVPMDIVSSNSMQHLTAAFTTLWKAGVRVKHWMHHKSQTSEYTHMLLPAYQFDKQHQHWLPFKSPPILDRPASNTGVETPRTLFTLLSREGVDKACLAFRLNTSSPQYRDILSGHVVCNAAPICPATLEIDIVVQAIISLDQELYREKLRPQIRDVNNLSPLCENPSRLVYLQLVSNDSAMKEWDFRIYSNDTSQTPLITSDSLSHVTGHVQFHEVDDMALQAGFSRLNRLVKYERCLQLLNSQSAANIVQGQAIYRMFSNVVDYGVAYQCLQKLVGDGLESAGRVVYKGEAGDGLATNVFPADCFSQVGGMFINCFANQNPAEIYLATGFEEWTKSPGDSRDIEALRSDGQRIWDVFAAHTPDTTGSGFLTDIFVFDKGSGCMVEAILGIRYTRVLRSSMIKIITRLRESQSSTGSNAVSSSDTAPLPYARTSIPSMNPPRQSDLPSQDTNVNKSILLKLKEVLSDLSGIDVGDISDTAQLADIGIDSLMAMELARDIQTAFGCTVASHELMYVTDLPCLFLCVQKALGGNTEPDVVLHPNNPSHVSQNNVQLLTPDEGQNGHIATSLSLPETSVSSQQALNQMSKGTSENLPWVSTSIILDTFEHCNQKTDENIKNYQCQGYLTNVLPRQDDLCMALTIEAFSILGCDLDDLPPGSLVERIPHSEQHTRLCDHLYQLLESAGIVKLIGTKFVRTSQQVPPSKSEEILKDLLRRFPEHELANRLTYRTGSRLAKVIIGELDGTQVLFGTEEARQCLAELYGDSMLNKLSYNLLADFLGKILGLVRRPQWTGKTINILEVGGGTAGATKWLIPMLAQLGLPIHYTFTDLSPSFVSAARKTYKQYNFITFAVHDVEAHDCDQNLLHSQHIIIASNVIHATHCLETSARNLHRLLKPRGLLLMIEMTTTLQWVDLVFGVLQGWWLFDDGRQHAIVDEHVWCRTLHNAGFWQVKWTSGELPESQIQRIFIGIASDGSERLSKTSGVRDFNPDPTSLEELVDNYITAFSAKFSLHNTLNLPRGLVSKSKSVLVTGATGSLGSYLAAHLAASADVDYVYCLNRRGGMDATARQMEAFTNKRLYLDKRMLSKLVVLECDTSKSKLDLENDVYDKLVRNVTHLIHNAWPMSGKRPLKDFRPQFETMRNLVDLAGLIAQSRSDELVTFQFISSISVVGNHSSIHEKLRIPEERTQLAYLLDNGYSQGKFVCERILAQTLHRYPEQFRTMIVRPGQVAGSSSSGYWNPIEHVPFMIKSSHTLKLLPDLKGPVSWVPVNEVAAVCTELLLNKQGKHHIYHVDRRLEIDWNRMITILGTELGISAADVIPLDEWVDHVRRVRGQNPWENPASKMADVFERDFERMSCGGVFLDTRHTLEDSATFRDGGSIDENTVKLYLKSWRDSGFLC